MKLSSYIYDLEERGKSSFTMEDLTKDLNIPKIPLWKSLSYFKKKGTIVSPARGLYVIIPVEYRVWGCLPAQDLIPIVMNYLNVPYYAGLLTAAMYHGAAHQRPQVFQVISGKRMPKQWTIGKIVIRFVFKKHIEETAIEKKVVNTGYLNISTPEETAKDILTYHRKSGGLNHQATLLSELIEAIDIHKLIALAKKSKQTFWLQRMGYILSKIDPLDEEKKEQLVKVILDFLAKKKHIFVPLAANLPTKGKPRDKIWKIIENTTVESDI